jgi:hypothetical protein
MRPSPVLFYVALSVGIATAAIAGYLIATGGVDVKAIGALLGGISFIVKPVLRLRQIRRQEAPWPCDHQHNPDSNVTAARIVAESIASQKQLSGGDVKSCWAEWSMQICKVDPKDDYALKAT